MKETSTNKQLRTSVESASLMTKEQCFCCGKYEFFRISTLMALGFDIFQLALQLSFFINFSFNTKSGDFQEDIDPPFDEDQEAYVHIETFFLIITFPLAVMLVYKTYYGLRWVKLKFTRPALQSYFQISWAFYTAFFIQTFYIMIFTWPIFSNTNRALLTMQIACCPPFFILMQLHMIYEDKKSLQMNIFRRDL